MAVSAGQIRPRGANPALLRVLGGALLADGAFLLAFGPGYVRLWQVGKPTNPWRRAMDWLAARPAWQLRLGGAAEAGLGLVVLAQAPLEVRSLYRLAAPVYDPLSFLWRDWLFPDAHAALDRALTTYLPPGGRVLDLGCGTGANLERLRALGLPFGSYTGVDFSEDMLARARRKFGHVTSASFQQRDLLTDALPEGSFYLIVSTYVFEHLPDPGAVVQKAWERLHPGGHMLLLFETETGSWTNRLLRPLFHFGSARFVPEEVYRRFPGRVAVDRFAGGVLALVVLEKPEPSRSP
ncbi:MAG: class I SAM-dependent methyltransferase [Chloroflexi bacterium]|nr:class I SAM-dependent methyltransferase [Chloroflexota bacterium]